MRKSACCQYRSRRASSDSDSGGGSGAGLATTSVTSPSAAPPSRRARLAAGAAVSSPATTASRRAFAAACLAARSFAASREGCRGRRWALCRQVARRPSHRMHTPSPAGTKVQCRNCVESRNAIRGERRRARASGGPAGSPHLSQRLTGAGAVRSSTSPTHPPVDYRPKQTRTRAGSPHATAVMALRLPRCVDTHEWAPHCSVT